MKDTLHARRLVDQCRSFTQDGAVQPVIVNQVALLACWAWCVQHRPELSLPDPDDRPRVATVMEALTAALRELGARPEIDTDWLEMNHSGRIVEPLRDTIAAMEWPDSATFVADLGALAEHGQRRSEPVALPLELARMMITLGRIDNRSVLFAYASSDLPAALATRAGQRCLVTSTYTPLTGALALTSGATVVDEAPETIRSTGDVVISLPPLGAKPAAIAGSTALSKSSDGTGAQLAWADSTRRAVIRVSSGMLSGRKDAPLREAMVRANAVDRIIQFPRRIGNVGLRSDALLVLDHDRANDAPVFFVDGGRFADEWPEQPGNRAADQRDAWDSVTALIMNCVNGPASRAVDPAEIRDNDFDLALNRYVQGPATRRISALADARPLGAIAEILRCQSFKDDDAADGDRYLEIGVRDLDESGRVVPQALSKQVSVAGTDAKRARNQRLYPGDVLIVGKGSAPRVARVGDDCSDHWIAAQVFLILRADARFGISSGYLFRYLASPLVQAYLAEITSESSIPILKTRDIRDLPVPMPSPERQAHIAEIDRRITQAYDAIAAHRAEIARLADETWAL